MNPDPDNISQLKPMDWHLIRVALGVAALMSRDRGHAEQANEFSRICETLQPQQHSDLSKADLTC